MPASHSPFVNGYLTRQYFKLTFQCVATLQSGLFVEILIEEAFEMLSLVLVIEQFPKNMSSKSDYFVPLICVVESCWQIVAES